MPDFPPPAPGITKLSELTIDVDKDWLTKNITNLGLGAHDLNARLNLLLAHASRHENAGLDEIDVGGLSGVLADEQFSAWAAVSGKPATFPPSAHASSHIDGGADELTSPLDPTAIPDKSVRAFNSAAQNVANTAWVTLNCDSENFDTDTIHDLVVNNSRLVCKTAGKYLIIAEVSWDPNSTGDRVINIWHSVAGASIGATNFKAPAGWLNQVAATLYSMAVNDYVEVRVWQNSGGTRTCQATCFAMIRVA